MNSIQTGCKYTRRKSLGYLALHGDVALEESETLLQESRSALADKAAQCLEIDFSDVNRLGTRGTQIILALKLSLAAENRTLKFKALQGQVAEDLKLTGVVGG